MSVANGVLSILKGFNSLLPMSKVESLLWKWNLQCQQWFKDFSEYPSNIAHANEKLSALPSSTSTKCWSFMMKLWFLVFKCPASMVVDECAMYILLWAIIILCYLYSVNSKFLGQLGPTRKLALGKQRLDRRWRFYCNLIFQQIDLRGVS